jgi:hypothetical protein
MMFREIRNVLSEKNYLALVCAMTLIFFALEYKFQLNPVGYATLIVFSALAFLSAVVISLQIKIFKVTKSQKGKRAGTALIGGAGVVSGVSSSIFATATCGICLSALFNILGAGTILFLVDNRIYIVFGAFLLLVLSLYLSARRLRDGCDTCNIA